MKRRFLLLIIYMCACACYAGVSTYEFTSKSWASKTAAGSVDGKTDGWVSDKDGYEYMQGRTDAQGRLYSQGVSVKTSTSGAGATSVKEFSGVRQITLSFCQNSSKGRGTFYVQVGDSEPDSLVIVKPQTSGSGVYVRDSVLQLSAEKSGKIRFWVRCTENAINVNSISIRSSEGGSNPFTVASYQLVTSASDLSDGDQIIIGVSQTGVNYIMGYFDESVSQNNIHAIRGQYSADRQTVAENDCAIYTLHSGETSKGEAAWYIEDELRYGGAYLVASGGQTKNRLALWDHLYDEKSYGDYGYWDIEVETDGRATIKNLGRSKGIYLQYNATNNPTLFGCYESLSQTPVCIYRRVEAIGDIAAIAAPMVNFGDQLLREETVVGEKTIMINANRLTEDISVSMRRGYPFSIDKSSLDRDGEQLTIRYEAAEEGDYIDTLVLRSGEIEEETVVMLHVVRPKRVAEAVGEPDFATVYLQDVVVTKKYDTYIFVRDMSGETKGSMMIYDAGDGTGHRYGSGLKNGDVLRGVVGRMRNYFGVPELIPIAGWTVLQPIDCEPELVSKVDSADVCRFVRLRNVHVDELTTPVIDAFDTGILRGLCTLDAIVYISWDEVQLWVVSQTLETELERVETEAAHTGFDLLGRPVRADYNGLIVFPNGRKILQK